PWRVARSAATLPCRYATSATAAAFARRRPVLYRRYLRQRCASTPVQTGWLAPWRGRAARAPPVAAPSRPPRTGTGPSMHVPAGTLLRVSYRPSRYSHAPRRRHRHSGRYQPVPLPVGGGRHRCSVPAAASGATLLRPERAAPASSAHDRIASALPGWLGEPGIAAPTTRVRRRRDPQPAACAPGQKRPASCTGPGPTLVARRVRPRQDALIRPAPDPAKRMPRHCPAVSAAIPPRRAAHARNHQSGNRSPPSSDALQRVPDGFATDYAPARVLRHVGPPGTSRRRLATP